MAIMSMTPVFVPRDGQGNNARFQLVQMNALIMECVNLEFANAIGVIEE